MSGEPRPTGRGRGSALSILASSALAALAVIALVGVLILAFGQNDDEDPLRVDTPDSQIAPRPSATSTPVRAATPSPTATASAPATVTKVPVVVLNQTTTVGLAAVFRSALRAGGWKVPAIGDFRGNVPATTVYYPPGKKAAAKELMAQFAQVGRIRPAFAGISTTQLTVILGKDFPT